MLVTCVSLYLYVNGEESILFVRQVNLTLKNSSLPPENKLVARPLSLDNQTRVYLRG